MSTPTSATGAASMTRLPPSPEITFILPGAPPERLSLDADAHNRLRSVARYATFHPQAIACSTPLQNDKREPRYVSSVGAIAGPNGIAVFRVARPQTPVVVLSHASSKKSTAGSVSSLSFQPQSNDSPLLLAAARGSGVLVWDASGHSLSPLIGRLAMEPTLSSSDRITSISWTTSSTQSLLATTNAMKACLWDIRHALRASLSRPSLQLGTSRKVNANGVVADPLVQIAVSNRDQVATLDASGTVQVFDIRMTDRSSQGSVGEVSSFSACHHVGIGLEFLPAHKEDTCWVTWGLDAPQSGAIVKVWSDCAESEQPAGDSDTYCFMDGSPNNSPAPSSCPTKSIDRHYQQVAEFSTPYLACARVSPEPFENQIVTVGMVPGKFEKEANGWHAEVWKLNDSVKNDQTIGTHYGTEKITSFRVLHDDQLASMIGTNATMGSLRGAELALETGSCELTGDRKVGVDLLLCCLSDNGYVTTQTVCEAPSRDYGRLPDSQGSPRQAKFQPERPVVYVDTTRVYPEDGTGKSVRDAASMMHTFGDSIPTGGIDTNGSLFELPENADLQYFAAGNDDALNESLHDGTTTQFDMDVPIAYGEAVSGPGTTAVDDSAQPIVLLSNEDDDVELELGIQRNNLDGRMNRERVPCPRLCGGSFSPGVGGIVCFHNGEVRKMWSWYEQSDQKRRIQSPAIKGGPSPLQNSGASDPYVQSNAGEDNLSVFTSARQELPHSRQECPRTLQDLEDMTDHARFSQWRSDESSEGDSSIDDQSDESLDESASGDDEREVGTAQKTSLVSPPRYVGKEGTDDSLSSSGTLSRQKLVLSNTRSNRSGPGRAFLGPTSDLVPTVYITHEHEDLVFDGQNKELARGWMLGEWDTAEEEDIEDPISDKQTNGSGEGRKDSGDWSWEDVRGWPHSADHPPIEKEPHDGPSHGDIPMRIPQWRSDPMLVKLSTRKQERKKKYSVVSDEDPVHAGAYSVRPSKSESMVFLKKVVTHQQDQQLQTLISPPDSPLLPNKMPRALRKRSISANPAPQTPSPTSVAVEESENGHSNFKNNLLGVYNLTEERAPPGKQEREERVHDICFHNAEVCMTLGQSEKANVWNLLSQMAENVLDNFNGWGGAYGASLGHDLVASFLDYYQAQGDVQMLATMVCVLSGGRRKMIAEGNSLLPASHEDRYDTYIRRYADVLSSWRLASLRAELNKHLVQRLLGNASGTVDLAVWCSTCDQEAIAGTDICRLCRNYAFRCSICDIAVRGLFTVCAHCGHGGHAIHMTPWFEKHSVCPTGCGCECVLTTSLHSGDPASSNKSMLDKTLLETPELLLSGVGPITFEGYS